MAKLSVESSNILKIIKRMFKKGKQTKLLKQYLYNILLAQSISSMPNQARRSLGDLISRLNNTDDIDEIMDEFNCFIDTMADLDLGKIEYAAWNYELGRLFPKNYLGSHPQPHEYNIAGAKRVAEADLLQGWHLAEIRAMSVLQGLSKNGMTYDDVPQHGFGRHCACQIVIDHPMLIRPLASKWVYRHSFSSPQECAQNGLDLCLLSIAWNNCFRSELMVYLKPGMELMTGQGPIFNLQNLQNNRTSIR